MSSETWRFEQTVVDQTGMPCVICEVSRLVVAVVVDDGISDEDRDTNGMLIAAAPDLLQALVYVHRFGSHGEIDDDDDENNGKSVSYFVEAAIARATTPPPTTKRRGSRSDESARTINDPTG